jgi:acyl-CoA synthetase (AMP-forming)/AMP-acid ligase II
MVNEMSLMNDLGDYRIPSLKHIVVGASHLHKSVSKCVLEKFGTPIVQGFGCQETTALSHALPCPMYDGMKIPEGSCGIPVASTKHKIMNIVTNTPAGMNEPGELWVKGEQIMKGYWNDQEKTRSAMCDGWFRTGDVVRQDEDGIIYFVERLRDIIKSGGHTISPTEIETILREHPNVKDCAVIGVPVGTDDEVAVGYIVPQNDDVDVRSIIEFVNADIAWYKHLREIRIIDTIPRSAGGRTGKIKRKELKEHFLKQAQCEASNTGAV